MIQRIFTWIVIIHLRHTFSVEDVSNHMAWQYLDSFDCGYSVADRIIGGDFAALGQFPWIVLLGFASKEGDEIDFSCAGALVTDRHVISAAHCLQGQMMDLEYKLYKVRMGEHNLKINPDCEKGVCAPPVQEKKPKTIINHHLFNSPPFHNDISLVVLDSPVELNDYVSPICLPRGDQMADLPLGENVTVAGWGKTNMTTEEPSAILKYISLPVVQQNLCDYFGEMYKPGPTQICAGGRKNEDSCGGDSGGPVMKVFDTEDGPKNFLVGVVSFGPIVCGIRRPAVYTSTSHFMKWILDNILKTKNDYN